MTGNLATKMASNSYFSMHDMHAYYGESYIVQGVSLDVNEGEILALLGRNGAGKTSTLRAIARLDDPQLRQGEIWLDGQSLHNMSSHQAAVSGVSLVPEDRRIIQGLTVEENIQLAQIVEPVGWSIERLYDLFPRLGERRKQEGVTLSGASNKCCRSPVLWRATLSYCSLMSPMRVWRRLSWMKSRKPWRSLKSKALPPL